MALSDKRHLNARVARLNICNNQECPLSWKEPHLSIDTYSTPLARKGATAISYAWGDFDRERKRIGHDAKPLHHVIDMELGSEWVVEDFIARLASISKDNPVWIDQLCMPQKDDAIREALTDIPSIYQTFDVAVLMPGHPCSCLPAILDDVENLLYGSAFAELRHAFREYFDDDLYSGLCLNTCPLSSWTRRLWTRQELEFSTRIRCVWASEEVAQCVHFNGEDTDLESVEAALQPYARRLYQESVRRFGRGRECIAFERVRRRTVQCFEETLSEIQNYVGGFVNYAFTDREERVASTGVSVYPPVYRFLSGVNIEKTPLTLPSKRTIPEIFAFDFHRLLQADGGSPRQATHSRDYVIAVFMSCERYVPPEGYKHLAMADLLQNALKWLQGQNMNTTFISSAPQGLFDSEAVGSAIWLPRYYLRSANVNSMMDVYGSLSFGGSFYLLDSSGAVPITYRSDRGVPLSRNGQSWEAVVQDKEPTSPMQMALRLKCLIPLWHDKSRKGWEHFMQDAADRSSDIERRKLLLCIALMHGTDDLLDWPDQPYSFDELHGAFYHLVCCALYLKTGFCSEKKVELMFSVSTAKYPRRIPRVGLCRSNMSLKNKARTGTEEFLTVDMADVTFNPLMFEAQKFNELNGTPTYRVFGVWVPTVCGFGDGSGASSVHGWGDDWKTPDAILL